MKRRQPISIAGVGAGYFAQHHYEAWSRLPDAALVGIADTDEAKARGYASKYAHADTWIGADAAEMIDAVQPDVLDIITPPHTHRALVELAITRRVSTVICQKPLAPTLREARAIVELAEAGGVQLIVHENFRWQPWFVELHRLLHDEKAVGTPYNLSFRLRPGDGQGDPPAYVSRQPYFKDMERFIVHETGIHFVDVFRLLFGEVRAVLADLQRLNPVIRGEDAGTEILMVRVDRREKFSIFF